MRKIIFVIFSFVLITINSASFATSGDGPLKFSTNSFNNFLAYMRGDGNPSGEVGKKKGTPLAFAINETGTYTFYYYCPIKFGDNCYPGHMEAMNKCTINSKKRGGGRCYVFAKKRNIVWDSKVIKLKRKFSEETIRRIFQENNWYGTSSSQSKDSKKKDTKPKITKKYSSKGERPLALSWEGYSDLIVGKLSFNEKDYKGTLSLDLTNNDGSCDGTYSLLQNGKGTWQISCTNDMAASGNLKWVKDGEVVGEGRDINNKKVKFTVGKKS